MTKALLITLIIILVLIIVFIILILVWPELFCSSCGEVTSNVSLSLESQNTELQVGDEVTANIMIDTDNKEISGVDIVITYDAQALELVGEIDSTDSVFSIWPMKLASQGSITFSALVMPGQSFTGLGKIASLKFKALKPGETEVYFVFEPDSTQDTNAAFNGQDLLDKVINAVYNIQ